MDAERAVLGSIIINPSAVDLLSIQTSDFFIERHRWIWRVIRKLKTGNVTPDFVSICDELDKSKRLDEVGGGAYLTSLVNNVPSSLNVENYAAIVQEKARRRKAIQLSQELVATAYDEKADLDEMTSRVVDELTSSMRTKHDIVHISEVMADVLDHVAERANNPSETFGIPTGFVDLDRMTGGVWGVWYLAGEPGVGKSILMLSALINAAKKGHGGAIFSLEMSALAQGIRALSAEAKIPTHALRSGMLNDDDWTILFSAAEEMAKLPIYICDEPELNTAQFRAHLTKAKAQFGVEIFALDYLYLMTDQGQADMVERTEMLSKRVIGISRQLGVPGITVNSVTKEGMTGKAPKSTSLRGSGQLIHDADIVIFISKHSVQDNQRTLTITKGRDVAETGKVDLIKMEAWPTFHDVSFQDDPGGIP